MKLKANHSVRNEVASTPTYWETLGAAVDWIDRKLRSAQLAISHDTLLDFAVTRGGETKRIELTDIAGREVENSLLVFQWHKLASGRYEVTAYLS